jgi:acyl dehydratase
VAASKKTMPIDPTIKGFEYEPLTLDHDEQSTILYALAVGAGTRDDELDLIYEKSLRALPTLPVVLPFPLLMQMESALGISQEAVLHGEQRLVLHRPVATRGEVEVRAWVSNLWDKGSGAIVDTAAEVVIDGQITASMTYSSFVRGGGGFGGERGTGLARPHVVTKPTMVLAQQTLVQQAQLYRLCGDTNPLHIDPAFARRAGMERPILHGLCTYGFATRMAMHAVADGDPAKVAGVDARFTDVVHPGETLGVEIWKLDPQTAYARVSALERQAVVIDPLMISLRS